MNLQRLTRIAVLAAMSYVLIAVAEIHIPPFPSYLKWDPSEVPAVIAAFTMDPVAGVLVVLIKDLLKLTVNAGEGGVIGMVANFLAGASLVWCAGLTRKALGSRHSLVADGAALVSGSLAMTALMLVVNGLVIFPLFYHLPAGAGWGMALAIATPFNLMKGALSSAIAIALYRPLAGVLRTPGPRTSEA